MRNPFKGQKLYLTIAKPDQPPCGCDPISELFLRGKLQVPFWIFQIVPLHGWAY